MKLSKNMYFSPAITEKKQISVLKKLQRKKTVRMLYLLISRRGNPNLTEIVNCKELYRLDCNEGDVYVYGVTDSKEDAVDFLMRTIQNMLEHYHTIDKKTLLMEIERDEKVII